MDTSLRIYVALCLGCFLSAGAAAAGEYDSIAEALSENGAKTYLAGAKRANGFDKQLAAGGLIATVFAPSDKAFARFFKRAKLTPQQFYGNTSLLVDVLQYHVVPGVTRTVEELTNGMTMTSMRGKSLTIAKSGLGDVIVMSGSNAKVIEPDLKAGSSAVVHIVDNLLLPKDSLAEYAIAQASDVTFFGSLDEAILEQEELTTFSQMLEEAGLLETYQSGKTEGTVFAPTNLAFEMIKTQLQMAGANTSKLFADEDVLKELLDMHMVKGKVMRRRDLLAANGTTVTTAADADVNITTKRVPLLPPAPPQPVAALPTVGTALPGEAPAAGTGVTVVDPFAAAGPALTLPTAAGFPAAAGMGTDPTATAGFPAAADAGFPAATAAGTSFPGAAGAVGPPALMGAGFGRHRHLQQLAAATYDPAAAAAVAPAQAGFADPAAAAFPAAAAAPAAGFPAAFPATAAGPATAFPATAAAPAAALPTAAAAPTAAFPATAAAPAAALPAPAAAAPTKPSPPPPPPPMITQIYLTDSTDEPRLVSPQETVAGKAVLHVIDGVLLPPSLAEYILNSTDKINSTLKGPLSGLDSDNVTLAGGDSEETTSPLRRRAGAAAGDNETEGGANGTIASRRAASGAVSFQAGCFTMVLSLPALLLAALVMV